MNSYNGFTGAERLLGDRIIKQAIKEGILEPLDTAVCSLCGQDKGIRHYHNEDYTPENIIKDTKCLCWRCHMILHSKYRSPEEVKKYFKEVKEGKRYPPVYKNDFKILERDHNIK